MDINNPFQILKFKNINQDQQEELQLNSDQAQEFIEVTVEDTIEEVMKEEAMKEEAMKEEAMKEVVAEDIIEVPDMEEEADIIIIKNMMMSMLVNMINNMKNIQNQEEEEVDSEDKEEVDIEDMEEVDMIMIEDTIEEVKEVAIIIQEVVVIIMKKEIMKKEIMKKKIMKKKTMKNMKKEEAMQEVDIMHRLKARNIDS